VTLLSQAVLFKILLYNTCMIELNIPGKGRLQLEHLVCDLNGTLTLDGALPDGMVRKLNALRDRLRIHLVSADTLGNLASIERQLRIDAIRIDPLAEAEQKAAYVCSLGVEQVAAIGQGANDAAMLKEAALGICVLSFEGTAVETLLAADLVLPGIFPALELFDKPLRIVSSLRK
jgi:soluble P-type ATPase